MKTITKIGCENEMEAAMWRGAFEMMMDCGLKWFAGNPREIRRGIESGDTDEIFFNAVLFANRIVEKHRMLVK
mgnify:CR=1 FL=1